MMMSDSFTVHMRVVNTRRLTHSHSPDKVLKVSKGTFKLIR